ncbi:ATP-binding protein [Acetobacterium wieringae]|uniref:ATP-binding protein n=1 Tax=Acetobacterium wieringae TaxID=52694 RepID=UPI001FA7FD52|nr:ATP-binding protein [Acetobacterium wieringae]
MAVCAIKSGYTAYFLSAHELISMIQENIVSGRIHRKLKTLNKPNILIIDEVGYAVFFASTFCRKLQVKNTECCIMENP